VVGLYAAPIAVRLAGALSAMFNHAPKTIISRPVHTAVASLSCIGASAIRRHESVTGL